MKLTDFGVAVIDGDLLSSQVEKAGTLASAEGWLQSFAPFIPEGGLVCDIGAALGDHTASYARMVGPSGRVHAIEPYAPFLECLRYNAQALPNVEVHGVALGCADGVGRMALSERNPNNHGMARLVPGVDGDVPITTLDALADGWNRVDFIKIDVEGAEPWVLAGAKRTLEKFRPVLLIEVNMWALARKGFRSKHVYEPLHALGYRCLPCQSDRTLDFPEIDVFCVPDMSGVAHG